MNWIILNEAADSCGITEIVAIDVGARWGIDERWSQLGDLVKVFGFDPDHTECERLNAKSPKNVRYVPVALGESNREALLYITQDPACSSLFQPNSDVTDLLPELACIAQRQTQVVTLASFDAWWVHANIAPATVMKIDTQGSELNVLQGARAALKDIQLLEIEVEFNPLYDGQPLFGDVDRFMRENGFVLWHIEQQVHYSNSRLNGFDMRMPDLSYFDSKPICTERGAGQLFWAHAYYTRSELSPASRQTIGAQQGIRAAIVAMAYGLPDLAHVSLQKIGSGLDPARIEVLLNEVLGAANQSAKSAGVAARRVRPEGEQEHWLNRVRSLLAKVTGTPR